ncbi:MAG: DNA alkylation repair protein [Eubacteriales bacterium]|nr:DNA alkylation repair protein [Eubacteriales bacterium]
MEKISREIQDLIKELFENQDLDYREFHASLNPTVQKEHIIGVRTPVLRAMAKKLKNSETAEIFLSELPHIYFEENQLHAFLISETRDYDQLLIQLERFLPHIDNWATCDQLRPKLFKKHPAGLIEQVCRWLASDHTYTIRFAIGTLMSYYLDDAYEQRYLDRVSRVHSDEYYVNMMTAWYFATALAKQYDDAVMVLEDGRLDQWVHNKTIQKARESFRITADQKEYLKTLKR